MPGDLVYIYSEKALNISLTKFEPADLMKDQKLMTHFFRRKGLMNLLQRNWKKNYPHLEENGNFGAENK